VDQSSDTAPPPPFPRRLLAILKAPGQDDAKGLEIDGDALKCPSTEERFAFIEAIPSLYVPPEGQSLDVTNKVRSFYEENPFPSYEGMEEFAELVNKGSHNAFSADLLKAVGYNKLILECGCGTGQLSHFLQLNNNNVLGIDMSLASLALAVEHKNRNGLERCAFAQMNIFDLAIKDNAFDVVISHGVLHHTYDARKAFSHIVKKLRPGGIIMVGLYNRPARIMTWLRSKLIAVFGPKIDYVVRNRISDVRKAQIWINDQYYNPHETWHSIDEVLAWFDENDIEFLNCSPAIMGTDGEETATLFSKAAPGSVYQRLITQLSWIGTIAREGALFDVIGRKKEAGE